MKNSLFFICILLLASCSSVYRFTIEVQEPAPVTLPPDIVNILVVNNSVPQPGDAGINRIFQEKPIEGLELNLDSLASIATVSLASGLQTSRFFNQVLTSPVSLRNDSDWMSKMPLPETFKSETFNTHGFDGIISIDRILIQLNLQMSNSLYANFNIYGSIVCSIYTYGRNKPLASFAVSDSLSYATPVWGDTVEIFKELPESLLEYFASAIGEQLSRHIIPAWSEKERFLYSGSQSRMHEAFRFAQKNNWNQSINLWKNEYARVSQAQEKGELASNLAVAYEMQDQLDTALQWAITAQNHFGENERESVSAKNTRINTYVNELRQRIIDNYLLDLQWGVSGKSSGESDLNQ